MKIVKVVCERKVLCCCYERDRERVKFLRLLVIASCGLSHACDYIVIDCFMRERDLLSFTESEKGNYYYSGEWRENANRVQVRGRQLVWLSGLQPVFLPNALLFFGVESAWHPITFPHPLSILPPPSTHQSFLAAAGHSRHMWLVHKIGVLRSISICFESFWLQFRLPKQSKCSTYTLDDGFNFVSWVRRGNLRILIFIGKYLSIMSSH